MRGRLFFLKLVIPNTKSTQFNSIVLLVSSKSKRCTSNHAFSLGVHYGIGSPYHSRSWWWWTRSRCKIQLAILALIKSTSMDYICTEARAYTDIQGRNQRSLRGCTGQWTQFHFFTDIAYVNIGVNTSVQIKGYPTGLKHKFMVSRCSQSCRWAQNNA